MTEKEKFYANEKREKIFEAVEYHCQYPGCQERAIELAHCIKNNKTSRLEVAHLWNELFKQELTAKQLEKVIHCPINTIPVCGNKAHNDFYNLNSPMEIISQLYRIKHFYKVVDGDKF